MGLFDSYARMMDLTNARSEKTDVKGSLAGMQQKLNGVAASMAAMNAAAVIDPASEARRVHAVASVTAATSAGVYVAGGQVVTLELFVMLDGGIPVAVSHTEVVPALNLARVSPGSRVAVTLDPAVPASLRIEWATPLA